MSSMSPSIFLIESGSSKLFTVLYQKHEAETVILLHGGPGVPMDLAPISEQLVRGYQVIAFDQRGTGRSPAIGASYAIDEYIKDLDAITHHFDVNEFHLFGHSWGGLYAQIYAEKNPQRIQSMFLSSPSSGTGEIWKVTESEVMSFNKSHSGLLGWSMMGVKSLLGMLGSDKAYQSLFKQVLENYNKDFDSSFSATEAMVENVRAEPINKTRPHILEYQPLKDVPDCQFPVMITYGQKDIYGESKKSVRNRFPKATFIELQNAGHIAWKHNNAEFVRILIEFYQLEQNEPT
ncbi:MAG TPA: alpha/beta hydrolase [Rhizobium sp.]|nr:alpha/beta hydrolase [Rhizobium sp.]